MSYCRWSDNGFDCDVYCYQSNEGYVMHLAVTRLVSEVPKPQLDFSSPENLARTYAEQSKWVENARHEEIHLPFDGQSYCFETPKEAADKLIELKEVGYHVPQWAIDSLVEEANEKLVDEKPNNSI